MGCLFAKWNLHQYLWGSWTKARVGWFQNSLKGWSSSPRWAKNRPSPFIETSVKWCLEMWNGKREMFVWVCAESDWWRKCNYGFWESVSMFCWYYQYNNYTSIFIIMFLIRIALRIETLSLSLNHDMSPVATLNIDFFCSTATVSLIRMTAWWWNLVSFIAFRLSLFFVACYSKSQSSSFFVFSVFGSQTQPSLIDLQRGSIPKGVL